MGFKMAEYREINDMKILRSQNLNKRSLSDTKYCICRQGKTSTMQQWWTLAKTYFTVSKHWWLRQMALNVFPEVLLFGRHTLGRRRGGWKQRRARVRCAWAKFKELSPILTARGASYRIKGSDIRRLVVQSALTYGTETWAMKKANLQSLKRTERMMVRWMCRVSLRRIGNTVWICTVLWVYRASMRWWGGVDWGGLGMWNV